MSESAFKIEVSEGTTSAPWRVIIFGVAGIGKSTFATTAPDPLFIDLENGLARVNCRKTQHLTNFKEFLEGLRYAYTTPYKTIVIDTISKLEDYLVAEVCRKQKVKVLGDIPWGKGADFLLAEWTEVFGFLAVLQASGKNILLIGHDQVTEYLDPTSENYHRYSVRLHKKTLPFLTAEVDAVLFCHWEKYVKAKQDGKGRMAVGTGSRLIRTVEDPSVIAKNRFSLSEIVPMDESFFPNLV